MILWALLAFMAGGLFGFMLAVLLRPGDECIHINTRSNGPIPSEGERGSD